MIGQSEPSSVTASHESCSVYFWFYGWLCPNELLMTQLQWLPGIPVTHFTRGSSYKSGTGSQISKKPNTLCLTFFSKLSDNTHLSCNIQSPTDSDTYARHVLSLSIDSDDSSVDNFSPSAWHEVISDLLRITLIDRTSASCQKNNKHHSICNDLH